ncbi:MAG TPA: hypothetical protein ENI87_03690 [bacterium]|nr:hypothetical protein [bacterium]
MVALVVGGSAVAQDNGLQEAVNLLRLNKKEEAVQKLQEIISSDPSNEEAHELYMSVSQDEWYLLMTQEGEIQKIAESILARAKTTQRERSRDMEAIQSLVDTATDGDNDYGTRQQAINKLIADHGEFAVPALLEKLGDKDDKDGQIHAINVLSQLHSVAVLPLIEALKISNALAVQNAAAALYLIDDGRALPVMAHLANDDRVNISTIAKKFVQKHGGAGDALDLMLKQSSDYLKGVVPMGGYSDVIWQLVDDKLVATDVPALLYPTELAKAVAADAVRMAPESLAARAALAAANLGEANLIESSIAAGDESVAEMGPVAAELKVAAMATGVDALRQALDAGVTQGMAPVAIGAIDALAEAEIIDSIQESSLLAALNSSDKRVQYAAAEAIVRASRGSDVPQVSSVVSVLAQAVTEEKVNTIQVIAPESTKGAIEIASSARGQVYAAEANALGGMSALLNNPSIDVVVINEIIDGGMPEDIIRNIRNDSRMANTKIVIVAKDVEAAAERFGDEVGYIAAPLTAENLQEAVNQALEGVESPAGERAEGYASKASAALLELAARKADIAGALSSLALQLNRGDSVAVPAAKAIGLAGGEAQLGALLGALESGSDELKKAAATAIGNVLSRMSTCPDEVVAGLSAAMDASDDAGLRSAIAIAFGKAKVSGEKKLELLNKLRRIAGTSAEG